MNLASRSRIRKRNEADLLAQVHQQVAGGLGGPGRGRVSGHPEDVDPAGAHFHDEQDVEPAQGDGVEGEEVGGQQSGGLSAQEGPPSGVCSAWCRAEPGGGQDPADRARAHAVSEPGEFALDAAVSPGRILLGQAQHQVTDLVADRWAAGPVRIGPFPGDQAAVPGQQRGRGDDPVGAAGGGAGGSGRTGSPGPASVRRGLLT